MGSRNAAGGIPWAMLVVFVPLLILVAAKSGTSYHNYFCDRCGARTSRDVLHIWPASLTTSRGAVWRTTLAEFHDDLWSSCVQHSWHDYHGGGRGALSGHYSYSSVDPFELHFHKELLTEVVAQDRQLAKRIVAHVLDMNRRQHWQQKDNLTRVLWGMEAEQSLDHWRRVWSAYERGIPRPASAIGN